MAAKAAADTAADSAKPVMETAEKWAHEKGVPGSYLAGVKSGNKWGRGKEMSEEEFDSALKRFLSSPADGRKK